MVALKTIHQIAIKHGLTYEHIAIIYQMSLKQIDSLREYLNFRDLDDSIILLSQLKDKGFIIDYEVKHDMLAARIGKIQIHTKKCKELFSGYHLKQIKEQQLSEIPDWIQNYRRLFTSPNIPKQFKKVKSMGDPNMCKEKMRWFFEKYPDYADVDLIMNATQVYIKEAAKAQYKYLRQADYFIKKIEERDGIKSTVSELAIYCEEILLKEENISGIDETYGHDIIT